MDVTITVALLEYPSMIEFNKVLEPDSLTVGYSNAKVVFALINASLKWN